MRAAIYLLLLLCTGCNAVAPRIGPVQPARPGLPGRGAAIDSIPNPPVPRTGRDTQPRARLQCRTQRVPSGWVITAYQVTPECPRLPDSDYNRSVLHTLVDSQRGDVMAVCADQIVPRGWAVEDEVSADTCPGARVKAGEPTSIRIRRIQ